MHACGVHTWGGWSSIVLNVQSADNVPGGRPTLPTNLAIVRATSRAPYIRSSVYERASAGRDPILKFHSDRRKRGEEKDERIAEQAIYSNRWFIRAFKQWRSKFSAHLRLIFALILNDFVRGVFRTQNPLSVLTAYSSTSRGYITTDLKKALCAT